MKRLLKRLWYKIYWNRFLRIRFDQGNSAFQPQWVLKILFGHGAGYKWGRTLYLSKNAMSKRDNDVGMYRVTKKWRCGFTQNSNHVPWSQY